MNWEALGASARSSVPSRWFHWQHGFSAKQYVPKLNITRVLGTPGGTWYWTRAKDVLDADFIAHVEDLLADG